MNWEFPTTNGGAQTFSYTNAQGTESYTVNYSAYTLVTNFGCSNIAEVGPVPNMYLATSITTPTGGAYSIGYETTPNYSSTKYPPPYTTGRIASITLPSGGSISYAYSGGNNGINCTSQVIPTLVRTISDNNGNVSKWTYVNANTASGGSQPFTVAVTDPANNQTVYTFVAGQYQTQTMAYQGGCPTSITG